MSSVIFEAVAVAFDLDDFCVVQEAVEYGCGGRDVADELAPFFEGSVLGHECGAHFVASHDNLKEIFAGFWRQLFDAHVVDDEQVAFGVALHRAVMRSIHAIFFEII